MVRLWASNPATQVRFLSPAPIMIDTNRLTQEERAVYEKLLAQKKALKEQQQVVFARLRTKACDCRCHAENIFDYHWFDQCC
jgi:hypothetical protein